MKRFIKVSTVVFALAFAFARDNSALALTPGALASLCPKTIVRAGARESSASDTTSGTWLMTWTNKERKSDMPRFNFIKMV
jgi:hypothetical protein